MFLDETTPKQPFIILYRLTVLLPGCPTSMIRLSFYNYYVRGKHLDEVMIMSVI